MFSFFFLCSIRVVKIRQIESENEFRLLLFLHAKHVTSSEINVVLLKNAYDEVIGEGKQKCL